MAANSVDTVHLLFREQWWGANCFSTLSGVELEQKVKHMGQAAQEQLHALSESDLNAKYIPNEDERKAIVKIARGLQVESTWQDVLANTDYEADKVVYLRLGYILFRVRLLKNAPVTPAEVRPNYLQQIVFLVWNKLTKDNDVNFQFDESTPPYAFSVCTGYAPAAPVVEWTKETIDLHKKELGQWAELYSGQFEDYRADVYQKRVENDLSNRQSEIHLINRNSALIYMDPKNYDAYLIKYAE